MRVTQEIENEVEKLPKNIQMEWNTVTGIWSSKPINQVFTDFKSRYENFNAPSLKEFAEVPEVVYNEWRCFKRQNGYETDFKTVINNRDWKKIGEVEKTFTGVWSDFKELWQYNSIETKKVFKEMELLSKGLLQEWRMKYNFDYPHVYEKDDRDYSSKTKAQLWKEFKEIWDIDTSDYSEKSYKDMVEYISKIECETDDYCKDYPRNFYDFRENANYHSYSSYSVLEQFKICEDWESYREENYYESETDTEEETESIVEERTEIYIPKILFFRNEEDFYKIIGTPEESETDSDPESEDKCQRCCEFISECKCSI